MNQENTIARPSIPRQFMEPNALWVAALVAYASFLFFGFGYASYLVAASELAYWQKAPMVLVTIFLASGGLHLFGWAAHEGIHLALARNKTVSIALGSFLGSILLFPAIGFGLSHWPHHRFTNEEDDPDTRLQAQHRSFARRFFIARVVANRAYFKNTFDNLFGRPMPETFRLPFPKARLRQLNLFSLVCMVFWLTVYISITMLNPLYGLMAFILPYTAMIPITGLRVYVEHAGTGRGMLNNARTYSSPFYTALLFGNNYHLEHHLYPKVPCYNLPRLHRHLHDIGFYPATGATISNGILEPLKFTRSRHPYPGAEKLAE